MLLGLRYDNFDRALEGCKRVQVGLAEHPELEWCLDEVYYITPC